MKLLIKIIGYTAATIMGLIVIAFISLQLITNEQYKKWITAAAESATGRELAIDGEFDVSLGTKISLTAQNVHFANADWGSRDDMARLDRLFVEVRLLPLVTGVLDFIVEVDRPDVLLETDADGTGNWVLTTGVEDPVTAEPEGGRTVEGSTTFSLPLKPYIRNLEISGLVFAYEEAAGTGNIEATVEQLRIFVEGSGIPLMLKGSYQGAPIELGGSLGSIEQWHANQKTVVSLEGTLNEAILTVSGSAGPMLPRPNARLDIGVSAGTMSTFDAFAGLALPGLEGLDLSFTLVADDGNLMLENVKADLRDTRLSGSFSGRVANLGELSGIELSADFGTEKGGELAEILNLGDTYKLPATIELAGGIAGSLDALSIEGLKLHVKDQGLDILLAADLQDITEAMGGNANVTIDLESTSIINRHTGLDLPSFGPLNGSARVVSVSSGLELEALQLELSDPALTARLDGSAENIINPGDAEFKISGIELTGAAQSDRIKEIVDRFGVTVPVELPTSFNLDVAAAGSLDTLGITSLEAVVKDSGADVALSGTVGNVMDLSGIAAEVKAAVQDSAALSKYAGVDIPALGSVDLQAKLASAGDTYAVDGLVLTLDGDAVTAQVTGNIADLSALAGVGQNPEGYGKAGIDADVALQTPSLKTLLNKAGGIEVEELGSLDVKAHLGSTAESIALDALQASLVNEGLQTTVNGTIEDLIALSGLKAEVRGELDSLSTISTLAGTELPQTGPWSFTVQANQIADAPGGLALTSEVDGEGIRASIDGQLSDLKTFKTFQTNLQVTMESVARIAALFDYEMGKDTTLKLNGELSAEPGTYLLEEFVITANDGEINADLAYRLPPEAGLARPKIEGKVSVNGLDISPFLEPEEVTGQDAGEAGVAAPEPAPDPSDLEEVAAVDQEESDQAEEQSATGKRIFSDGPLAVGWLNNYDADLQLEVKDILFPKGNTGDAEIRAVLDQGRLRVDPIDLSESYGGTGDGYVSLDAVGETAILDADINLDNFTSPRFGGTIDLHLDLDGEGASIASIMSSLNGYFAMSLNNLELNRSYLSQFGAGLLKQLNPLDSEKTVLECGVVRFDIEDGIADFRRKIAAQTTEVTWLGGGKINLKTEEIDVGISPKARGAISSLTNIDLASLVHIGGTLAKPRFGIDLTDVAYKYAGYTAFLATGGLSFLAQKIVDTARANVDQCERILGELENSELEPESTSDSAQPQESDTK